MVMLKEELDIVNSCLNIIRIRFENRFDFIFHLDEALLSCLAAKLLLPWNGMPHGAAEKEQERAGRQLH